MPLKRKTEAPVFFWKMKGRKKKYFAKNVASLIEIFTFVRSYIYFT